ncbi:MAG: DUF2167 domain-containing protein [Sphingobium sp.]
MLHYFRALAIAFLLCLGVSASAQQPSAEQQRAYEAKVNEVLARQKRQTGDISIPEAKATLHLGKDYYFLDAEDAREVIVDFWGNPPEQAKDVLGLVFPARKSFVDEDAWGAVITYEQSGYVKDDDAASTDYDALMTDMQAGEEDRNKARTEAGYRPVHLAGWAERPIYDRDHHSVIWARDLRFAGTAEGSLNYDVRLLGRYGVLSLNMVSGMSHLADVKAAARKFGASVNFDQGARYADYVPNVDKAAEYGIGGLIAAGAGVAAVKKLGLLAVILAFGKKLLLPIILIFGVAGRWLKGLFGRKAADEDFIHESPVDDETQPDVTADPAEPDFPEAPGPR